MAKVTLAVNEIKRRALEFSKEFEGPTNPLGDTPTVEKEGWQGKKYHVLSWKNEHFSKYQVDFSMLSSDDEDEGIARDPAPAPARSNLYDHSHVAKDVSESSSDDDEQDSSSAATMSQTDEMGDSGQNDSNSDEEDEEGEEEDGDDGLDAEEDEGELEDGLYEQNGEL